MPRRRRRLGVAGINDGDYISFTPVNLQNIDQVTLLPRTARPPAGGSRCGWTRRPASCCTRVTLQAAAEHHRRVGHHPEPPGRHARAVLRLPRHRRPARRREAQLHGVRPRCQRRAGHRRRDLPAGARTRRCKVPAGGGSWPTTRTPTATVLFPVLLTPPANGTLVLYPDGSFTYTPNAGFMRRSTPSPTAPTTSPSARRRAR